MRDLILLIPTTDQSHGDCATLRQHLTTLRLKTWSFEDLRVGSSELEELDAAVSEARALILVHSGTGPLHPRSGRALRACQVRSDALVRIFFFSREGLMPYYPSLRSEAEALPKDPASAADACADALARSPHHAGWVDHLGAYSRFADLSHRYIDLAQALGILIKQQEYDPARILYWKILHYTGYRELWAERSEFSNQLLTLSNSVGHHSNSAEVLLRGIAYERIEKSQVRLAESSLVQAYESFRSAKRRDAAALCANYLGDLRARCGLADEADKQYQIAEESFDGLERDRVALKRRLLALQHADMLPSKLAKELRKLRDEFKILQDYRFATVDRELAIVWSRIGENEEALRWANQSVRFFREEIVMPREAIKSESVLEKIRKRVQ